MTKSQKHVQASSNFVSVVYSDNLRCVCVFVLWSVCSHPDLNLPLTPFYCPQPLPHLSPPIRQHGHQHCGSDVDEALNLHLVLVRVFDLQLSAS